MCDEGWAQGLRLREDELDYFRNELFIWSQRRERETVYEGAHKSWSGIFDNVHDNLYHDNLYGKTFCIAAKGY
jgi:hypothetical protein